MPKPKNSNAEALRTYALSFPEAREDFPWGERVVKVKDKVFVFLGRDDEEWGVAVKLPSSGLLALSLPFASPTGYGLGKAGWVSAKFTAKDKPPPLDMLKKWIEESYRAVAPKTLVARLDAPAEPAPRTPSAPRKIRYKKKR